MLLELLGHLARHRGVGSVPGKHELDGLEAGGLGGGEALQEGQLLEEEREVGRELHHSYAVDLRA